MVLKTTISRRSFKNATKQEHQGKEGIGDTTALSVEKLWKMLDEGKKQTLEITVVSLPRYNVLCL